MLRWCRIRCPSTSSSSQPCNRGQARASASWAISTTPASLVTRRELTRRSMRRSCSGSVDRSRRGTRLRTGSPSAPAVTKRSTRSRSTCLWSSSMPAYTVSADRATAPRMPPDAAYPATVRVRPSRRFQVSIRAWDMSGRAPGVPATSPTRRSTSPASISSPDCRAGSSIASRSDCSLMPPSRCRLRSTRRAKPGWTDISDTLSARIATTTVPGPNDLLASSARNSLRSLSSRQSEKTSSHWSTTSTDAVAGSGAARQRPHRVCSRGQHHDGAALTAQRRGDPGPDQATTCRTPRDRPRSASPTA